MLLSAPEDYDGGELVIEDTDGTDAVKLRADDIVLYPGTSLHRVTLATRGQRLASFFRDPERRRLMFGMDVVCPNIPRWSSSPACTLLRRWSDTMRPLSLPV